MFLGSAIINGNPAPEGTVVAALIDGVTVSTVEVNASGRYGNLQVSTAGAAVTFTIGGLPAAETATSEVGGLGFLNLTATGAAQPADTPVPPTAVPAPEQQGDSGGSCGSSPDRSFSNGAGDMALLILPLLGLVGWAGLIQRFPRCRQDVLVGLRQKRVRRFQGRNPRANLDAPGTRPR